MEQEFYYLINQKDLDTFGCPYCGCCSVLAFTELMGGSQNLCESCNNFCYSKQEGPANILNYLDTYERNKIVPSLEKFPTLSKDCQKCLIRPEFDEEVSVFSVGRFVTPGCFISGGNTEERDALLLKTTCKRAAKHITGFFKTGVGYENDCVFIGASKENLNVLYKLMLEVIKTKKISYKTISKFK